jgi:hypothetical protein
VPKFEGNICWAKYNLDVVADAVVFLSSVPPVAVLELK